MAISQIKRPIVKKRRKKFVRFQKARTNKTSGNYFIKIRTGWRKPKGIDNRARRKFKGTQLMPNCGYGSNKKTRHMLPSGFYKYTVRNMAELDMLMMHNKRYQVEIGGAVGAGKRKEMVKRADQLGLHVINRYARMSTEENE